MENVQQYFEMCKSYWLNNGDSEAVAASKAFWWDMVEVYNADNSWTPEKRKFAEMFRGYKPGDPVPDADVVANGGV